MLREGFTKEDINAIRKFVDFEPIGSGRKAIDSPPGKYEALIQELSYRRLQEAGPKKPRSLDETGVEYGVTPKEISEFARILGESSGNINKLSSSNKEAIKHLIKEHGTKTDIEGMTSHQNASLKDKKIPYARVAKAFMPAFYVIQKHGGEPGRRIADKILQFDVVFNRVYKGFGDSHV